MNNFLVHDAALMNLANLGEYSRNIPDDIKTKYSQIDWKGVRGLRNVITHNYPGVDLEEVWQTMQKAAPGLLSDLEEIMDREIG